MSTVEGGLFLGLYVIYVLVVVNFERVLELFSLDPLDAEEFPQIDASASTEHEKLMEEPGEKDWDPTVHELYTHVAPVSVKRFGNMEWYEKGMIVAQVHS